jgi:predicted GIY-YIG superfamily endonuclease
LGAQKQSNAPASHKYNVNRLVYYEEHELSVEASRREQRFKIGGYSGR